MWIALSEKTILGQCYFLITGAEKMTFSRYRGRGPLRIELAPLDHVELAEMYDFYLKKFHEEKRKQEIALLDAFIMKNRLFCKKSRRSPDQPPPDPELVARALAIYQTLDRANYTTTRSRLSTTL